MSVYLHVGGLVAAGFDTSGSFMLVVSHSGLGVFSVGTWERVARDPELAYPEDGIAVGIGPIAGLSIPVTELNYETEDLSWIAPDGSALYYAEGVVTITPPSA